jgi:uncharacterized BrkB/YihY/UPF0761 family membrane protein
VPGALAGRTTPSGWCGHWSVAAAWKARMGIRRERNPESKPSRWKTMRADYEQRLEAHRKRNAAVDFAMRMYERDREIDGSVVASAVALRVFLFFIPLLLVAVGVAGFLGDHISSADASKQAGVSGTLAAQINDALKQSNQTRWIALLTGLFGAAIAGRTLARVLAAASRRAWGLSVKDVSVKYVRLTGAIAGLIAGIALLSIVSNRVRQSTGPVGGSISVATASVLYAIAWLLVTLALPRGRSDRSVLLPGAVVVGAAMGIGQWLLQFEAPDKLSHASKLYGAIGTAVVVLGWFFLIGRMFVLSLTVNAVLWDKFGSITTWLLSWKRLRRTVENHPRLDQFLTAGGDDTPDVERPDVERDAS